MDFVLTLDLGNSAFDHFDYEQTRSAEAIAKCLRHVATSLNNDFDGIEVSDTAAIRDVNGNTIGSWSVTK